MASRRSWIILLSLAASMAVLSNAEEGTANLLDTEGRPLKSGLDYLILSQSHGLTLTKTCPQYVVTDRSGQGLPVVFHPVCPANSSQFDGNSLQSYGNTAVRVTISAPTMICGNKSGSNAWSVARVSGMNQTLVKIVSGEGRSFMISKVRENEYGLFSCPVVICKRRFGVGPACSGLGIHTDDQGNGWIVAGNSQPLLVKFKQAPGIVRD